MFTRICPDLTTITQLTICSSRLFHSHLFPSLAHTCSTIDNTTMMMHHGVRASGLKRVNRPLHPLPIKPLPNHDATPRSTTVTSPLTLPPTPFVSSIQRFTTPRSPSPTPPYDLSPPSSSHKRMRRSASPPPAFDNTDAFASCHTLLTLSASPTRPPITESDSIESLPPPSTDSEPPPSSSYPPISGDPTACEWTIAQIIEKGAAWSEHEYKPGSSRD